MKLRENKLFVYGTLAASAVIVGTLITLQKRKRWVQDGDDDVAFAPCPLTKLKPNIQMPENSNISAKITLDDSVDAIIEESLNELVPKKVETITTESTGLPPVTSAVDKGISGRDGNDKRRVIEHLGVSLKIPRDWEVREELSPIPNIAMVTIFNPEIADGSESSVPGSVPLMILSVEDIRAENLNLTEFKNRSKTISMSQMHMMTNGAVEPVVRKDTSTNEGPFRHILEYSQSMLPFFDIAIVNLLEVRNGIAYVFQIMCNPSVMNQYRHVFLQIAREMELKTLATSSLGYLKVHTGCVSIHIDTMWGWNFEPDGAGENNVLARFEQLSTVKPEEILLYKADSMPQVDGKVRKEATVEGVVIQSIIDGAQERKVFRYGDYVLVLKPLKKAISYIPESVLVNAIKSVEASTEKPRPRRGATFYSPEYGYHFDVVGGSRVVSTKLGAGTVVYAPDGIPYDINKEIAPEEQGPTVTIRIGSPENDADCMPTIEEWHTRIKNESAQENITNIQLTTRKNQPCLCFTSKEMQDVGPNQKIEVRGDVYIFVRDGITTLIRWETGTGKWRKYESDLDAFFESFTFIS